MASKNAVKTLNEHFNPSLIWLGKRLERDLGSGLIYLQSDKTGLSKHSPHLQNIVLGYMKGNKLMAV